MGDPQDSVNQAIRAKYNQGKIVHEIPRDAFSRPKPADDGDAGGGQPHNPNLDSSRNTPGPIAQRRSERLKSERFRQTLQSLYSRKD